MCKNYGVFRIHGLSMNLARQLPVNQVAVTVAPPFSLGLIPSNQQTKNNVLANANGIAANNYDVVNHMKYVNENEIGWWSRYYPFNKDIIITNIGSGETDTFTTLPIGKPWIAANTQGFDAQSDTLEAVIGYDIAPTFASTATNQSVVVAQLDLTYYVEFAIYRGSTVVQP